LTQFDAVSQLVETLQNRAGVLVYAQNIATAIVDGPANHCAATLSALLVFVAIFPNGGGTGSGDLEPWVPALAFDLEKRRGWLHINIGAPIQNGDVGVVILASGVHHIYFVVDATNQLEPLVADNQAPVLHFRAIAGDPAQNWSPTSYFLRPPDQ
jgi:hypothetical protein